MRTRNVRALTLLSLLSLLSTSAAGQPAGRVSSLIETSLGTSSPSSIPRRPRSRAANFLRYVDGSSTTAAGSTAP